MKLSITLAPANQSQYTMYILKVDCKYEMKGYGTMQHQMEIKEPLRIGSNSSVPFTPFLVNAEIAAKMLGMGKSKLYELVKARKITYFRDGRLLRFRIDHLQEYVDKHTMKGVFDERWIETKAKW